MEIIIWLVVVIAVIALGYFGLQALRKKNTAQVAQAISREAAEAANAKLDDSSRNSVYRNLAKGDVMGAVQIYRAATGDSVKNCVIAVRSLDKYPQVAPAKELPIDDAEIKALSDKLEAQVEREDREASTDKAEDSHPESTDDLWVVPQEWSEQFGLENEPSATHFKMAFELDGESREFSSEQLPANEYDQLFSMLRDSNFEEAAKILHGYTGLPVEDLERMIATSPMSGGATDGSVADFRFEGQGPDGPVHFDAAELPEADREALFEAIADTDLDRMSEIIVRHTSLPEDIVQNMLQTFVKRKD
ncbi:hypothetical protein AOZ07_02635 [Glutamicibacter halophytocola]|uniref:Uncharacterized protein n=1 Tax=Glutamicibacter halophytocola TaxID=1933880 RepID=A0ABX5YCJ0_9MICC|nr:MULTISPECIES: hypothetical protein [Glutamicibacter]ALG28010.1 hypothetical protein AOZ07_02635 [Glutamicibacter halophytocola]MBF6671841.1 hypothetical protein [Glutamicibacter sp. FBE19]NQD40897.1 hypothetical protein [Glutamicibacter halophytocola]QDY67346.1 hypothetical protein FQA45_14050 [Glutamicibacter halophytocola]